MPEFALHKFHVRVRFPSACCAIVAPERHAEIGETDVFATPYLLSQDNDCSRSAALLADSALSPESVQEGRNGFFPPNKTPHARPGRSQTDSGPFGAQIFATRAQWHAPSSMKATRIALSRARHVPAGTRSRFSCPASGRVETGWALSIGIVSLKDIDSTLLRSVSLIRLRRAGAAHPALPLQFPAAFPTAAGRRPALPSRALALALPPLRRRPAAGHQSRSMSRTSAASRAGNRVRSPSYSQSRVTP